MLNITKRFPGIVANDNITLQLKKGEIHALLGKMGLENQHISLLVLAVSSKKSRAPKAEGIPYDKGQR